MLYCLVSGGLHRWAISSEYIITSAIFTERPYTRVFGSYIYIVILDFYCFSVIDIDSSADIAILYFLSM